MSPGLAGRFPGDCSGYRVPLPGLKLPSAAGSPGVVPDVAMVSAACLRRHSVPGVTPAGVPRKAEIEAVGAFGRRSFGLARLRPCPLAFQGSAASLRTG